LHSFSGIFPVPEEQCKPTKAAQLTKDQQAKYEEILAYMKQQETFPTSLKAEEKGQEPASEWEKLRYLSRESMLRYLRATRWDVKAAQKRLTDTIAWHREFGTQTLDPDEMAIEAKSGKETVLGYDNSCRPLHYMHPHRSDTKESPRQMQFAVWILERCIDMMPPGVEQLALLINFEGRSRNPTSIANAKLMLYILQNHYVERLGIALCINVPWVFKMFWNAIQAFIDPVTKSKCRFDEAVKSEVPLAQLSADFGGDLDPTYNHEAYWSELVKVSQQRRNDMLRRFKEDCKGEIGASEWIIRGGDDPTSPFNVNAAQSSDKPSTRAMAQGSEDASTDTSSVAPVNSEMHGSAPLETFKTPMESIQPNPLDRTFSVADKPSPKSQPVATTVTKPDTTNDEAASPQIDEERVSTSRERETDAAPIKQIQHAFKDIEHRLQASKLFAAFHPDSHHRKSAEASRSSTSGPQDGSSLPLLQPVPSAHEIAAVAGTAGPQAAAGAVGAIVAEQARDGVQRIKVNAETQFAAFMGDERNGEAAAREVAVRIVNVLFFAAAKDAIGGRSLQQMAFPADVEAMSLREFRDHMFEAFEAHKPNDQYDGKAMRKVAETSKWSVNEEMVEDEQFDEIKLHGGEDVAMIPPVSGG
jgi:molybdopterin converting factor small subunit